MSRNELEEIGVGIMAGVIFVFLTAAVFLIVGTLINNVNSRPDTSANYSKENSDER